jgi:hypothetical protein
LAKEFEGEELNNLRDNILQKAMSWDLEGV